VVRGFVVNGIAKISTAFVPATYNPWVMYNTPYEDDDGV
jgi:hypothetical protein